MHPRTLIDFEPYYFQILANPYFHNPRVFKRMQNPKVFFFPSFRAIPRFVLNPFVSKACGLLGALKKVNSFVIKKMHALLAKQPGGGGTNSTRARTQRRASRQRPRAHAESWAQRRRNVAQGISATGAAALVAECPRGVGTQPVAARFALRIDALHGEAGQKLHSVFPSVAASPSRRRPVARPEFPCNGPMLARIVDQPLRAVKAKDHNI